MMRTYAGHSTAQKSNELYRSQPRQGPDRAFDRLRPADADGLRRRRRARARRGREGRRAGRPPRRHGGAAGRHPARPDEHVDDDQRDGGVAAGALHRRRPRSRASSRRRCPGTTQNDIIKEFLARGTYAFPPGPSMRLIADMIAYTVEHVPKWNPINICSYHLQEAGATPVQEIAYAMSNAIAVLDAVRERVPAERMGAVFGRISFFVNAGVRFVEEHAKLRAMGVLWEELGRERYGVTDAKHLRFRYGVQVNSLGPDRVPAGEQRAADRARGARGHARPQRPRARAIQLPAWNEALGLPRPWDQQWSLRIQQVLAYETDLLEYPDIFEGSMVMDGLVAELLEGARAEMARRRRARRRGRGRAVHEGRAGRLATASGSRRIEAGEQIVVGRQPLHRDRAVAADRRRGRRHPDRRPGRSRPQQREALERVARRARPERRRRRARRAARASRASDENIMPATIAAARAGVTTGEWAQHAARRVRRVPRADRRRRGRRARHGRARSTALRDEVDARQRGARPPDRRSSSASPASTATPTAPSRSPCARATPAWTSSTRASA